MTTALFVVAGVSWGLAARIAWCRRRPRLSMLVRVWTDEDGNVYEERTG